MNTRFPTRRPLLSWCAAIGIALASGAAIAEPAAGDTRRDPQPASPPSAGADLDDLYQAGQQLFDTFAPPEVKAQYDFPTKAQWDAFTAKLQVALQSGSFEDLASYAPQARAALSTLRRLGADDDLADWLEQRLDEAEAAQQIEARRQQHPQPTPRPPLSRPAPPVVTSPAIPYYDLWLGRVRTRPAPAVAATLMPRLRSAFAREGAPPALAWVAEAESSLNPTARSPAGARGLFQLTADTAKSLGLSTFLPDERTNPDKSARAAARYLLELHGKFGSWPLALAAYNAGAGRVSRAMTQKHAKNFAEVADALPAETRMYVPKVCALIAVRTGTSITAM